MCFASVDRGRARTCVPRCGCVRENTGLRTTGSATHAMFIEPLSRRPFILYFHFVVFLLSLSLSLFFFPSSPPPTPPPQITPRRASWSSFRAQPVEIRDPFRSCGPPRYKLPVFAESSAKGMGSIVRVLLVSVFGKRFPALQYSIRQAETERRQDAHRWLGDTPCLRECASPRLLRYHSLFTTPAGTSPVYN